MAEQKFKQLGRTGIKVFPLGFGGHPIQRLSEENAVKVLKSAFEQGINYIDTSRSYPTSEQKVGIALKGINKKIYISSQTGADTKEGALADIDTSLKLLGVEKIDIYQLHAVNTRERYEKKIAPGGALEGLKQAQAEGKIDYIGITAHNNNGDLLVEALKTNQFDTVMFLYNFMEYDCERELIKVARDLEVGMIAMKPLAGARLSDAAVALKYVLRQEGVVPICGMDSLEYVAENIKIAKGSWEYTEDELKRKSEIEKEVDRHFCRRCEKCQPCPQGIPISVAIRAESFIKRIIPKNLMSGGSYYNNFQKARECTECGICVKRCPYHLDIPKLIKENTKLMNDYLESLGEK